MPKTPWHDDLFAWLMDIKTLLAVLLIVIFFFWQYNGHPERLLNMADNILTAVFSLAVGYKLGKASIPAEPPTEPPTK